MQRPGWSDFVQLRRLLPVTAAVLFVGSLLLPMWTIEMQAVQYPDQALHLGLYAYPRVSGDYVEIARLNKYIGFYYPDPVYWQPNYEPNAAAVDVPEWSLGPFVFVAVAATGLFVAVAPTVRKLKQGLTAQLVGTLTVFGGMLVDIQYRLYQTGHSLDPEAPVMGVEPFTPPLLGEYSVANITSYSRFGPGAYVAMVAIVLLVVAFVARDSAATPRDVPGVVRERLQSLPGTPTSADAEGGEPEPQSTPPTDVNNR